MVEYFPVICDELPQVQKSADVQNGCLTTLLVDPILRLKGDLHENNFYRKCLKSTHSISRINAEIAQWFVKEASS